MLTGSHIQHRYRWVIAAACFVVTTGTMGVARHIYPLVLPSMKEGLELGYGPSGSLASAILMGYLVFSALGGLLATRYSPRLIISLSIAVVSLSMLGLGVASWYPLVVLLMLTMGMGVGGAFIPSAGLVTVWFAPRRRGLFMALTSSGTNAGILATALFVPPILLAYGGSGWRYAWVYFGLGTLVTALVGYLGLRDKPKAEPGATDTAGITAGASPSLGAIFRNRTMLQLTLAYFFLGFFSIYVVFIIAFVTNELGYSASFAASLWVLLSLFAAGSMVFWGYLSDLMGRRAALVPSSLILLAGILLPVLRQDSPYLYASVILFGASFLGTAVMMITAAGDMAGPGVASATMGLATMGHGLGQVIGPAIGGVLIDVTRSFYPAFLLAASAILIEVAFVVTLRLPRPASLE